MKTMTIEAAADALAGGAVTAQGLVEAAMARIAEPGGEGARAFIATRPQALVEAQTADRRRREGRAGRYEGIPFAAKDLFDVAGQVTRAGSTVLADAVPAAAAAPAVARMLAAGFVLVGRTNMTEFAYSGVGLNPHYGTPRAPWDRATGRIPGGSSSGSAVAVADEMALVALGTDTGGSCRIPAALCGVVGFKPTQARVPLAGAVPLSPSLDSVGPLGRSVGCCATVDAILVGEAPRPLAGRASPALLVPEGALLEGLEPPVADAFERAMARLSAAGGRVVRGRLDAVERVAGLRVGLSATEAYAWHRARIAERGAAYDPRVRDRILGGAGVLAADYLDLLAVRREATLAFDAQTAGWDAVALPTVPILPPPVAALEGDDAAYWRANGLLLRNTSVFNFLDRCAISLPVPGEVPVGLMLVGERGGDQALLSVAAWAEAVLRD